jgi:hypothetical protein
MNETHAPTIPDEEARGQVVLYRADDGTMALEVNVRQDTVWLSLVQMAELFGRDKSVISRHIRNIFTEGEHAQQATVTKFATVQQEGNRRIERVTQFYDLDLIVSVGYRVKSERGRQFRLWATNVLRGHVLDGYTVNPRRLATLHAPEALPAPAADDGALTPLARRRDALTANPAEAVAQLAAELVNAWPARAEAEPWAAAILQTAAHLLNSEVAGNDERIAALARMLARGGEEEGTDVVAAVAAALTARSDAQ